MRRWARGCLSSRLEVGGSQVERGGAGQRQAQQGHGAAGAVVLPGEAAAKLARGALCEVEADALATMRAGHGGLAQLRAQRRGDAAAVVSDGEAQRVAIAGDIQP
ncbi:hypothetical protein D3C85_1276350 [compost metagenome]